MYKGSKSKVKAKFSEFYVAVGVHKRFVLSPLLFAIVVDVVKEALVTDDLVKSETMQGLKQSALESKETESKS